MTKKQRWEDQKAALLLLMTDPNYSPMTEEELKQLLLIDDDSELCNALSSLIAEKKIRKNSSAAYERCEEKETFITDAFSETKETLSLLLD